MCIDQPAIAVVEQTSVVYLHKSQPTVEETYTMYKPISQSHDDTTTAVVFDDSTLEPVVHSQVICTTILYLFIRIYVTALCIIR